MCPRFWFHVSSCTKKLSWKIRHGKPEFENWSFQFLCENLAIENPQSKALLPKRPATSCPGEHQESARAASPCSFTMADRKRTRIHHRRRLPRGSSIISTWQSMISTMADRTHWPVSEPPPPAASTWQTERTKLHHSSITAASNVQPLALEHRADGRMPTAAEEKVHSSPPPKADQTCAASSKEHRLLPVAPG